ncbi:MAG: flagellar protein FliS [Geothrix sp.]|uniref:flagellar export chaperone FliS n=1 Tax=Geothrix sp. TaxID=1962974 RepID=UPI0017C026ED|nr:flagellar export chaperone FliS [Geothrix sp.]NWJ41140.1 flagellar protein FliS [Geothrix sp.]
MTLIPNSPGAPVQCEPPAVPEHMVVLLLEGGQRVLVKLEEAIASDDPRLKAHFTKKMLAILDELRRRLNHDQGGDLVDTLDRLYDWWHREILLARSNGDVERLKRVHAQMGDMRQAWEYVLFQGEGMSESPEL